MTEETTMTMAEFLQKHKITSTFEQIDRNPNRIDDEWSKTAAHYLVTLLQGDQGMTVSMEVPYSMGSAHRDGPTAADVLDSLASNAESVHGGRDFEDWAQDLGFDPDSRKAERSFNQCVEQTRVLRRFLGDKAYEELLYKVERL